MDYVESLLAEVLLEVSELEVGASALDCLADDLGLDFVDRLGSYTLFKIFKQQLYQYPDIFNLIEVAPIIEL